MDGPFLIALGLIASGDPALTDIIALSLKVTLTRAIEDLIGQFSAEGITIVMTSHDLFQARRLAQDIAFLHRGRLIEHGPAVQFFDAPQTPQARDFLGGALIW